MKALIKIPFALAGVTKRRVLVGCLPLGLALTPYVTAEASAQSGSAEFDAIARSQHETGRFHGAILVADGDDVLYRGAFGMADRAAGTLNRPEAAFPIHSITKSFTAILTLQLVQEGVLDLDGSLRDYLPSFSSEAADRTTIHHLLSHTSGLPDYMLEVPGFMEYQPPNISVDSALAIVAALPLEFEPGEGFAYSNTGYVLLGRVIERATGKPYARVLDERILQPLGMTATRWGPAESLPGMARQYLPGAEREAPPSPYFIGQGGIISTLDDMRRFGNALGSPGLLSRELWEQAFTPHALPKDARRAHPVTRFPYGYGFSLLKIPADSGGSRLVVQHGGLGYGGSAMLQRLVDGDEVVVFWNNVGGIPPIMPEILSVLTRAR